MFKKNIYVNEQKSQTKNVIALSLTLIACTILIWHDNYQEYKVLLDAHNRAITVYNRIERSGDMVQSSDDTRLPQNETEDKGNTTTTNDGAVTHASLGSLEGKTSSRVAEQIREIAKAEGFDDAELLVRIAFCESSLNPEAKNKNSSATGLYQILDMHQLSVEDRQDIETSTKWVINKINNGGLSAWNASKHCWG
jgi:hypothetical protein